MASEKKDYFRTQFRERIIMLRTSFKLIFTQSHNYFKIKATDIATTTTTTTTTTNTATTTATTITNQIKSDNTNESKK